MLVVYYGRGQADRSRFGNLVSRQIRFRLALESDYRGNGARKSVQILAYDFLMFRHLDIVDIDIIIYYFCPSILRMLPRRGNGWLVLLKNPLKRSSKNGASRRARCNSTRYIYHFRHSAVDTLDSRYESLRKILSDEIRSYRTRKCNL